MDNFSAIGSHISGNSHHHHHNKELAPDPHFSRAPSAMDPLMTGPLHGQPQQQAPILIQNGIPNGFHPVSAPLVMPHTASTHNLATVAPTPVSFMGYPSQPLPPVPPVSTVMPNQQHPQLIQNGMNRNMSTDSFSYLPAATKPLDSPQLSSSGRGSTRVDSSDSSGPTQRPNSRPNSRPVTPVQQQPLGLPTNRAKLVPGRMSNTKLDSNRPGSRREIPSTAVWTTLGRWPSADSQK